MVRTAHDHDPCVVGDQQFFHSETLKLHRDAIYVTINSCVVVSKEANYICNTQVVVNEAS